MEETALHAADEAYNAGDWRTAAREYLLAAGAGGPGTGVAFAKAGNALAKLGRHADAVMAYQRALDDPGLMNRAAVLCNLGAAQAAMSEHEAALESFRSALEDAGYTRRYKALQGAAASLAALGRFDEACEMYRAAALEPSNPDPGRSLNGLGVCYLSQRRYDEAVEAFTAALGVDGHPAKGRAAANLGLALYALGRPREAIEAFDRATGEFGYALNQEALAVYDACRHAVAQPKRETVEGWRTGEMPPLSLDESEEDLAFFTRTEEEMRQADREARRAERAARRQQQGLLIRVGSVVAVVAVVVGLLGFLWASGVGFPTQQMTVKGLLEAHSAGKPVDGYWVAVPAVDVEKEMSALPPRFASYRIGVVDRSAKTSTVEVTIVLEQGAPLAYKVSLAREGVGWKVSGIANDWRSTGD